MKTIGVIGGIGPQATMDFEARVHAISQRLIPQSANSGYPPMVVYYHRALPFMLDEHRKPLLPLQPDPQLTAKLDKLGEMVDFVVITSNATHMFRDIIEETTGRKVLSMIDITLQEVQRLGWRKVGVLGFGEPKVYTSEMARLGIAYEVLAGEIGGLRDKLDQAIHAVMMGQAGPADSKLAMEAVDTLRARGVDGIILGCTEIPLLMGDAAQAPDLINPLELLAEAAVKFAIQDL
ncbi:MAG TPA: amino acid racemase [Chloroflexia bacterium]